MSHFDDFLKKKTDKIQSQREEERVKDKEEYERTATLQKLASAEWPKLLPAVLAETNGRDLDGVKFVPLTADSGVTLGHISLVLLMNYGNNSSPYRASYKTFGSDGIIQELDNVNLMPVVDDTELKWNASALNPNSFSTAQLAEALAMKLVDVYQDNLARTK